MSIISNFLSRFKMIQVNSLSKQSKIHHKRMNNKFNVARAGYNPKTKITVVKKQIITEQPKWR